MAYIVNRTNTDESAGQNYYRPRLGSHVANDLFHIFLGQDNGGVTIALYSEALTSISSANPGVCTYAGVDDLYREGMQVYLTTSGTLPSGLTTNTTYYVKNLNTTSNTFNLAATSGGTAIDTSGGAGSGTHTIWLGAYGWSINATAQSTANGVQSTWAYHIAADSATTSPVFKGQTEQWQAICFVVRDADTSTPIDSSARGDVASGATSQTPALTTNTDGCLIFQGWNYDSGRRIRCKQDELTGFGVNVGASTLSLMVGAYQQETAGAITRKTGYCNVTTTGGQAWSIAIKNKSGGAKMSDSQTDMVPLRYYGDFGTAQSESVTWVALNDATNPFAATIASIPTSASLPTVTTGGVSGDPHGSTAAFQSIVNTGASPGVWQGAYHTISSTNLTNKFFQVTWSGTSSADSRFGEKVAAVGFSDGTNWVVYQLQDKLAYLNLQTQTNVIALGNATALDSSGSINWGAVTRIAFMFHRTATDTSNSQLNFKNAFYYTKSTVIGGGANQPAGFPIVPTAAAGWLAYRQTDLQGLSQVYARGSVQIGNGSTPTYFNSAASSFEFPEAFDPVSQFVSNVNSGAASLSIYASASDTVIMDASVIYGGVGQNFSINASSSTSATYSFDGLAVIHFPSVTWKTGVVCTGVSFQECGEIDAKGADLVDCSVTDTSSTDAAIAFSENGGSMTRCTIDVSDTSAAYHIELGSSVTAITLEDVTFTGTPGTDKVHVKATSGTVTITVSGTTALAAGDITSDGATVSLVAPTVERGQNFTGLVAGSKVKVFTSGTQTVLYGTDSSGTSFAWDDATSGSITVDYTIQQAGYLPIRVTGVVLTGAVGTGQVDTPITQVTDRAYVASSGLTYGTTAVVTVGTNPTTNPGTKTFQISTASTGQNWYSFWIEQWIDKGDTGEALANVEFPLQANGPNSFTLRNGWEFSDGATSIAFLSRDGIRYLNTSGTRTAAWAAILTAGVPSGARVRYQQSDGGTTGSAVVTSGNMDELLQVYGDATHGNFDRTGYLVLKVQEMGYDQAESDVYATYGTLEDQLYVVGLSPTANSVATGNPSLANPPTITDHGASPVTWNSKSFSITITDSAAGNSGTDIMKWLRYNFETGGSFQSKDGFNWHDLVQQNGDDFKTVRGKIYGDTGASLKGVRVVTNGGTDPHPDFTLFTADDGTTYAPPPAASVTISGLTSGSRVQLYDTANSTELYNATVAGMSLVFSETYTVDRTVRVRITYVSGTSAKEMIEATVGSITSSAPDISYVASQSNDDTYNTNAVDGSLVTNITINDTTDRVEIAIAGGSVTWSQIYAYQVYWLNTEVGIRDDFAFIESPDPANYILTSFKIKNTHATNPLTISGGWGRDSSTGLSSTIIDTTSTSNIYLTADHVIPYATGSGVTSQDKVDIASEVLLQAQSNPIYSEIIKVAGETVTGSGTETDPWGPV